MMRSHTRKAPRGPTRYTSQAEEAHQPLRAVQRKVAGSVGTTDHASCGQASTAKVVILAGCATLIGVMLMAFTIYAMMVQADEILKELLSFTQYLTVLVIVSTAGPQVGSVLIGMAKFITKR